MRMPAVLTRLSRRTVQNPAIPHTRTTAQRRVDIAPVTGPMDLLRGRTALVLADMENLVISARKLDFEVDLKRLATTVSGASRRCALHAFFSREPGDHEPCRHVEGEGWIAHPKDIERVVTHQGVQRRANSDNLILFATGLLVSRSPAEVVVVGSGDGDLVCDVASAIAGLTKPRLVVTLSLAGSTSWRLNAATNAKIAGNIELGLDCLRSTQR